MIAFLTLTLLALAWGKPASRTHDPMINEGLFEGDIMGVDPNTDRNAIAKDSMRWPDGVVPYVIDPSLNRITAMIQKAMKHIEDNTCIRFEKRTSRDKDYIRLYYGTGCWSYWGFIHTGKQDLSLGEGCDYHGTVVHELLHAIGFEHEHNRSDRDDHLDIYWENIQKEWYYAFNKLKPEDNRLLTGFDFESIMLYGQYSFSKGSGLKSMVPKDGRFMPEVYDKKGLSESDIERINILYECED